MKHVGIFIEPNGSLAAALRSLKAEVGRQLPAQPYCSHPPHSTLIAGNFQPPNLWREQLAAALKTESPFTVCTTGFTIFHDDTLAGGGHTVAFKVEPSPELFALQKCCADALKSWRAPDATPAAGWLGREPFRSSFSEYGFPFVGAHWIPHFTVASLKVAKDSPLLRAISSGAARHEFLPDRVSVWKIAGDLHTKLFEVPFSGVDGKMP